MTKPVFVLTETNGQTGFPLGVFDQIETAVVLAKAKARCLIHRCTAANEATFGVADPPGAYEVLVLQGGARASILVVDRIRKEAHAARWDVERFDVVERTVPAAGSAEG